jgi:erythromycin esterase
MRILPKRLLYALVMMAICLGCERPVAERQPGEKSLPSVATIRQPHASESSTRSSPVSSAATPFEQFGTREQDTGVAGLESLGAAIGDARVVLLGESSHGVAEFAVQRERIIRYLHEQEGFSVLALEAPMYDCDAAGRREAKFDAASALMYCAFPVWTVSEVEPLFRYLRERATTDRPIRLAGFDVQLMGTQGSVYRPAYLRQMIERVDPRFAREIFESDSSLLARAIDAQGAGRDFRLSELEARDRSVRYGRLRDWLARNDKALARAAVSDHDRHVVRQLARSGEFTLNILKSTTAQAANVRDEGMAANLDFLMDSLYPTERIIVWAHNEHIRYGGADSFLGEQFGQPSMSMFRRMGNWLRSRRGELYSVGFFMRRGYHRLNDGQVLAVSSPRRESLEERFGRSGLRLAFVDLRKLDQSPPAQAFRSPMTSFVWGAVEKRLVLSDEYDGLLLVDSVGPSRRLRQPRRAPCCPKRTTGKP